MVKRVEDWTWISYHAMIGNQPAPTWLNSEWALSQFGATRARQRERYAEFMRQGIEGAGVWQDLKGQISLGMDAFAEAMKRRAEQAVGATHTEISRLQRRALAKLLTYYRDTFDDKKEGMAAAYGTGDFTLQQVADAFAVHYATVSRTVNGK